MEIDIEEYFDTTTYDVFTFASEDFSIIMIIIINRSLMVLRIFVLIKVFQLKHLN